MAISKPTKPSVANHIDHDLITPDTSRLRGMMRKGRPQDTDPVARAEAALAGLSGEFSNWMNAECQRLDAARQRVKQDGLSAATRDEIFLAAHDIKGDAGTFGYPEVIAAAESLCRLLEHSPDLGKIPLSIVDQHVDAVRAMVREHGQGENAKIAAALTGKLRLVTDELLLRENKDRPEVLKIIQSPSLVPSENF
jgi:chemotaxis protein histidine kinase CheA